jgi:hypothetical protein
MSRYITKLDQLYRFIAGKIILSRNLYRFIGDKNFGQKNCIALLDFFSQKLCICIALNDTFLSIAAHHCLFVMDCLDRIWVSFFSTLKIKIIWAACKPLKMLLKKKKSNNSFNFFLLIESSKKNPKPET